MTKSYFSKWVVDFQLYFMGDMDIRIIVTKNKCNI